MGFLKRLLIGIFLSPILCFAVSDASLDALFTSKLIPLNEKIICRVPQQSDKGTIVSFYSPDCSWCERQIKSLNQFQQDCESAWVISLIGIKGDKKSLHKVLRKTTNTLPAFIATPEFLTNFPELEATPITVFIQPDKKILAVKRGYMGLQNQTDIQCEGNLRDEG